MDKNATFLYTRDYISHNKKAPHFGRYPGPFNLMTSNLTDNFKIKKFYYFFNILFRYFLFKLY